MQHCAAQAEEAHTFEEVITEITAKRSEVLFGDALLVWTGNDEQLHLEALYFQLEDLAPQRILTERLVASIGMRHGATQAEEVQTFEEVITEITANRSEVLFGDALLVWA